MLRLWISKVKKVCLQRLKIIPCIHTLANKLKEPEQSAEGNLALHYDYVTTKGIVLPTFKALRPHSADEEEEGPMQYECVMDGPLPPTPQHNYMEVNTTSLQPQSIYDDIVLPE